VEEQGDKTDPVVSYLASKSLAEQAFWGTSRTCGKVTDEIAYIKDEDVFFDGVSINPPLVYFIYLSGLTNRYSVK
jgi:hypothetical protein